MQRKLLFTALLFVSLIMFAVITGCTSSQTDSAGSSAVTNAPVATSVPVEVSSSITVKNTGSQDIHAWIATDQSAWGGNADNRINPASELSVPHSSSASPSYLCIGRSEKVIKCTDVSTGINVLVWDGTNLNPGSQ